MTIRKSSLAARSPSGLTADVCSVGATGALGGAEFLPPSGWNAHSVRNAARWLSWAAVSPLAGNFIAKPAGLEINFDG